MSDTTPQEPPDFKPKLPGYLPADLSNLDRWIVESLSIQSQQNDWMINRLQNGERRFDEADEARVAMRKEADEARRLVREEMNNFSIRLAAIERLKERLTAKWVVVVGLCGFAWSAFLAFLGAWFTYWLERKNK